MSNYLTDTCERDNLRAAFILLNKVHATNPNPPLGAFSPDAYQSALAVHIADHSAASHGTSLLHIDPLLAATTAATHIGTDCHHDTSAALASIGTPVPCNAMPDPKLINPHFGPNHLGHVNAIRPNGLRMVFHALIAMKDGVPIRALVDTGASHSYINQAFLDNQLSQHRIAYREQSNWLTLANGSQVVSNSHCVLPLDIQTYQSAVECYTLPMSDQFDMILGQDWSIPAGAVISYRDNSLEV